MFPIPKITESFIDDVMSEISWHRYAEVYPVIEGQLNADYVGPNAVAELKIFEEEGLEKEERQKAIADLFNPYVPNESIVDIELETIPSEISRKFENLVSIPFKSAIKKASKQLKESASIHKANGESVLIAVNNGYSYLNADNFERLFVSRAKRDSQSIGYAACVTVEYHQGGFDAYVFCKTRIHQINALTGWKYEEVFVEAVGNKFNDAMTMMMRDQMNPDLWKNRQDPVKNIQFTKNGVEYIREAPYVPDSRFEKT
jgi:hypothetical protein